MKVLVVFGTRPEAIKMAPLVNELKARDKFNTVVCVTGQHRHMLDQVLSVFSVTPDYDLSIMKEGQTLSSITSDVLSGLTSVISQERPDIVLVHGDTTTSFAGALAAFYQRVPIGHVEAGLRTFDLSSPFPEEFNRRVVDLVTDVYFAPTVVARNQLLDENVPPSKIFVTGNTGIDALKTTIRPGYNHPHLEWAEDSKLIMITAHRRENLGEPMRRMFRAIRQVLAERPQLKAIYPIHMNPRVRQIADEELSGEERIRLIEPLEVIDFHNFMAASHIILTDSGGVQEEAPSLGKPVLVMRDTTERPEGVEAGTLKLVGTSEMTIRNALCDLLDDASAYAEMAKTQNPYGTGDSSRRIADILEALGREDVPVLSSQTCIS